MSMNESQTTVGADNGAEGARDVMLDVSGLYKSFGETRALVNADLRIRPGEIHALVGENGSGKTTLIKVLAGVIRKDAGAVIWEGAPLVPRSPAESQERGLACVYQETLCAAEQSVVDNIFMGMDGVLRRTHTPAREIEQAREVLTQLGAPGVDVRSPVWALSLAERQLVTIARSVVRPWRLLILDEGTSALDSGKCESLFAYLRGARAQGRSVLFTSHRMDEVEKLADTVTVLRAGSTVLAAPRSSLSAREILASMAGREEAGAVAHVREVREQHAFDQPVMVASEVKLTSGGAPISLAMHAGEIFGLAGLEGQGQSEFAKCLVGLRSPAAGTITVVAKHGESEPVHGFSGARELGLAYVPQDRKGEGLFFTRSIMDNFSIGLLGEHSRAGVVRNRALRELFNKYSETVRLQEHNPSLGVGTLSGGNQQKVLLARWLAAKPRAIILNDPLRGVDVTTKAELYPVLRALASEGLCIVLLSTELVELLALCDRIAVFHRGGVERVLDAATSTDTDIVTAMFGHRIETGVQG